MPVVPKRKDSKMFLCVTFLSCAVDETFIEVLLFQETSLPYLKAWLYVVT